MDNFFTIEKSGTAEFKDRGSRFIAYAFPASTATEFKIILQQLKKEHPKAVHHCFAYRFGINGNEFRINDDGEPSGTAGKPILAQLDSRQLTNAVIIIVRYFGGTLLGVPGLINAYKTAASLVLQTIPIVQKQVEVAYILHFEHSNVNEIMRVIKQYNCTILEQELHLFSHITVNIPKTKLESVLMRFKDLRNVDIKEIV